MGQVPYQTQQNHRNSCLAFHSHLIEFYFYTALKCPLWHKMFLSSSVCPTPVRHREREKNGAVKAVIILIYSCDCHFSQQDLDKGSHFSCMSKWHSINMHSCNLRIGVLYKGNGWKPHCYSLGQQ